jgi:hypothetical protein
MGNDDVQSRWVQKWLVYRVGGRSCHVVKYVQEGGAVAAAKDHSHRKSFRPHWDNSSSTWSDVGAEEESGRAIA